MLINSVNQFFAILYNGTALMSTVSEKSYDHLTANKIVTYSSITSLYFPALHVPARNLPIFSQ